jgi:hypothetical protein
MLAKRNFYYRLQDLQTKFSLSLSLSLQQLKLGVAMKTQKINTFGKLPVFIPKEN